MLVAVVGELRGAVVEGAAHAEAYWVDPEAYRARVLAFLERYLE